MKKLATATTAAVAAALLTIGVAQPANAQAHWPPVTKGCGSKSLELYWHSTGFVSLYQWKSNLVGFEGVPNTVLGDYYDTGDHTYVFGTGDYTFGFAETSGSVDSWNTRCVDYY